MNTLIAIPCMDMVQTVFFGSMIRLRKPAGTFVSWVTSSLVYDARNMLAENALRHDYDRVLWLDSDMVFEPDLIERLSADIDDGHQFVSALYFTRKSPVHPCVYSKVEDETPELPTVKPLIVPYNEYPDGLFEIAGCGFGAIMMTTGLLRAVGRAFPQPFYPLLGFGEDFSFCLRARELGYKLWCDSRVKVGHAGVSIINENTWNGR